MMMIISMMARTRRRRVVGTWNLLSAVSPVGILRAFYSSVYRDKDKGGGREFVSKNDEGGRNAATGFANEGLPSTGTFCA